MPGSPQYPIAQPDNLDGVVARRTVSEKTGKRGKGSFLISVLSSETATPSERAVAFLSLVDDIESIAGALRQDDYLQFREVLHNAVQSRLADAVWSVTLFPDEAVVGEDAIDHAHGPSYAGPRATRDIP